MRIKKKRHTHFKILLLQIEAMDSEHKQCWHTCGCNGTHERAVVHRSNFERHVLRRSKHTHHDDSTCTAPIEPSSSPPPPPTKEIRATKAREKMYTCSHKCGCIVGYPGRTGSYVGTEPRIVAGINNLRVHEASEAQHPNHGTPGCGCTVAIEKKKTESESEAESSSESDAEEEDDAKCTHTCGCWDGNPRYGGKLIKGGPKRGTAVGMHNHVHSESRHPHHDDATCPGRIVENQRRTTVRGVKRKVEDEALKPVAKKPHVEPPAPAPVPVTQPPPAAASHTAPIIVMMMNPGSGTGGMQWLSQLMSGHTAATHSV